MRGVGALVTAFRADAAEGMRNVPGERRPLTGRFLPVGDRTAHVLDRGVGRPIVLLHGNGSMGEEILSAFPAVPGVRWIAPDRPGYGQSDPLPKDRLDPPSQAEWLDALLEEMGLASVTLVAHSLAAAAAVALAATCPKRVERLILLAPFCRPTPEGLKPGLRLASAPLIGPVVRRFLVPPVVRALRRRIVAAFMAPNRAPPWLCDFPVTRAAHPGAVATMASELKVFNAGMERIAPALCLRQSVMVVQGLSDRTADPKWHLPWLRQKSISLQCALLRGCGHAVHHAAPRIVLQAVLQTRIEDPRDFSPPCAAAPAEEMEHHAGQASGEDQHTGYLIT